MYLQTEGLAMGNSLSQMLAEITTSHFLNEALLSFNEGEISFLYKYVDDIIVGIDRDSLAKVQDRIEISHGGMKLKLSTEDIWNEVNYLDLKIRRIPSTSMVYIRWTQKEFSSKRIIDFHSYHPYTMKVKVVKEYVKNALKLTSPDYRNLTINLLRKTLRNSNYEHSFINVHMNKAEKEINEHRDRIIFNTKKQYITCPYHPGAMNYIRGTIKKAKIEGITLAPLIRESNNKNIIFANLKDKKKLSGIKHSSFLIECMNCEFNSRVFTDQLDVERTAMINISNDKSKIQIHCKMFKHKVNTKINTKSIIQYRTEYDCNIAKSICK